MQWIRDPAKQDVSIGVVGPRELVERILLMQGARESQAWRLVGSSHAEEHETHDRVVKIADQVDAILFTGPLQYDLAHEHNDIQVPSTFIPMSGASLYSSIIRGILAGRVDPARVSVDSISPQDVTEAYTDIDVDPGQVHTREYQGPGSVEEFFEFHLDLYRSGVTSAALTTVQSVARKLAAADVPALRMTPPQNTIRSALTTAALLAAGSKLEEAQIAIVIVEVSPSSRPARSGPIDYWYLELVLILHRILLTEVRKVGATLTKRDDNTFVVTATQGSLFALTNKMHDAPFLDRIRAEISLDVNIGIGLGETPWSAEEHAYKALERARRNRSSSAYLVGPSGAQVVMSGDQRGAAPADALAWRPKEEEMLRRIILALENAGTSALTGEPSVSEPAVVDAETVASALGVTTRSARRMLTSLADVGLAWPMPPLRSAGGGRPRQQFRLVVERLEPAGPS